MPGNVTVALTGASCNGTTCTGTYTTPALTSSVTYQVTVTGPAGGTSSSPQVAITVNLPPTLTFALTPTVAAAGQTIDFSWATTNATSFTVTPTILGEDQSALPVNDANYPSGAPAATTTYVGTATGPVSPAATANAVVTVVPMTLSASQTTIQAGNTVTLTFSGPNNGSGYTLTTLPANTTIPLTGASCSGTTCTGTYTTPVLSSNTTYQVTANGPVGGTSSSPQVQITVVGQLTVTLTASPTVITSGSPVTLTWTTTNAQSISIDHGVGQVTPVSGGSVVVHPTVTTTYTATATDIFNNTQTATATVTVSTGGLSNLNHIIFMLQENRAFDNYFGVLANYRVNVDHIQGAQLSDVDDLHNLPQGYTIQNPEGQNFGPFHARTECIENLSPAWDETHYDMDINGDFMHVTNSTTYLMDRFLQTTRSVTALYDPTQTRPLGYYDQTDLPFYYELATQFASSDRWFSPIPANTIPNRMYLFAATSYGHGFPPTSNNDIAYQQPTIFRALTNAGITWRYYYLDNSVYLYNWADWNDPAIQSNVRSIQEWYNILSSPDADRQLPQVVFIERASSTGLDEHPENNVQKGAAAVQTILNALFTSRAWPDSAFILTYDEGGGLFDHVGPILATPPDSITPTDISGHIQGLFNITGFRVPVMVVSPWVKPHYVSHVPMDYTAILKLIETRYNVPPLTQRDANAGDMTDFFDFTQPNMLIVPNLPIQPTNGTCDQTLESSPN
jgi:phospholipase C